MNFMRGHGFVITQTYSSKSSNFIAEFVERKFRMENDETKYCIECGHYYNENHNGERIMCECECHG